MAAKLNEVRALERRFAEENAVVRHDADRITEQPREPAHERSAVQRLELIETAAVDHLEGAAAGDRIGAEITTGGTWDGTTADLVVTVWVLLYLDGI